MELRLCDLFKSYEMEVETHVHVQIQNQLGFHELQIACYNYGWIKSYEMEIWIYELLASYEMEKRNTPMVSWTTITC